REVARVEDGPRLPHSRAIALVATGFGVFIARGGFSVDLHAFRQEFVDDREARVRVLGLGALEYALLAPATCIVAILLLLDHVHQPGSGLTMPWAIAVPTGGVLALAALRLRAHASNAAVRGRGRRRGAAAVRPAVDWNAARGRGHRRPRLPDRQLLAADRAGRFRPSLAACARTDLVISEDALPRARAPRRSSLNRARTPSLPRDGARAR